MASSEANDEDLELALELSMQQSPNQASNTPTTKDRPIDLTSDTEDEGEDMRRAIAMSLQGLQKSSSPKHHVLQTALPTKAVSQAASPNRTSTQVTASVMEPSQPLGLFGLDRKAMEEERLARLGKRKRDPSPDQPSKQIANMKPSHKIQANTVKSNASSLTSLQYPRGTIKRTAATKYPRTDDITIDEVLQADSVHTAVISSFMWDSEWLNKKLNPLKVKQIWTMNAKGQDVQQRWGQEMKEAGIPNLRLHFPPMDGMIQSMHNKIMLLFGKDKLRVVVSTANMGPIDWGEVMNGWQPGVMENSVFLVDLPRRSDGIVGKLEDMTNFGKDLMYFLKQQRLDEKVLEGVLKFDFSQTSHLAFVHSIGGTHKSESQHPTGLPGLTKAIQNLGLDDVKTVELDYASASLGAINDNFLQRIYLAACGERFTDTSTVPKVRDHFRIYFPTDDTVQNSIGGADCGGIISLTRQYYNAATFPQQCMRNYDSTRRRMLSHNKLLFARGIKKNGKPFAWVYIGSANMSESAWGLQKVLKSGHMGTLSIRNWECGVLVPVPTERIGGMSLPDGEIPPMTVFEGTIEVPFACPEPSYGEYGDKQPWYRLG